MTHLSPCRTRVAVNVLEEFNDPDRVPFAFDAGEGALNHRLVKVEFQFLWLRGAEGIPVRFPNALRAGGIKLHDTIEIPPVAGNPKRFVDCQGDGSIRSLATGAMQRAPQFSLRIEF